MQLSGPEPAQDVPQRICTEPQEQLGLSPASLKLVKPRLDLSPS